MQPVVCPRSVIVVGLVALALGVSGGCGGEPNDPGIGEMESQVAPDAPKSMEEFYNQQQGGAAAPSS
jgi:hypothetical protein